MNVTKIGKKSIDKMGVLGSGFQVFDINVKTHEKYRFVALCFDNEKTELK